jgi:hypothetical protein
MAVCGVRLAMPVKVKCSTCQKVLSVPDSARGKAVKCPDCDTRIPVPAGDSDAPVKKSVKKKASTDDDFASLDLRNIEDRKARICPKCGCDLKDLDEDETECPKCGYDTSTGGMGAAAKKRALKGPDPDKFFKGLWSDGWKFVGRNKGLAFRSIMYSIVASLLAAFSIFMFLYNSTWPPRVFFGFVTAVCLMVIPGWYWLADVYIIQNAMEKKDKIKRLNFDFFTASALGIKFFAWNIAFAGPVLAIPAAIGAILVRNGSPTYVLGIITGLAYIPVLLAFPGVMGHMAMPISYPGWMFWKILPSLGQTFKGSMVWVLLALSTNIATIGTIGATIAVYGNDVVGVVNAMESNADIYRRKWAAENKPKVQKKGEAPPAPEAPIPDPVRVNYQPLIIPGILWCVAFVPFGFTALFNMRTNGQFVYYFRPALGLIGQAKQYKYKAILSRELDEEYKPKSTKVALLEAIAVTGILALVGGVGGLVVSTLFNTDLAASILVGVICGGALAETGGVLMVSKEAMDHGNPFYSAAGFFLSSFWLIRIGAGILIAMYGLDFVRILVDILTLASFIVLLIYTINNWGEAKPGCLTAILGFLTSFIGIILVIVGLIASPLIQEAIWGRGNEPDPVQQQFDPAGGAMPGGAMPGMPGAPGAMPGMPDPGGAAPAGAP